MPHIGQPAFGAKVIMLRARASCGVSGFVVSGHAELIRTSFLRGAISCPTGIKSLICSICSGQNSMTTAIAEKD